MRSGQNAWLAVSFCSFFKNIFQEMSGQNIWTRNREKMLRFSELIAQCSSEAAAYGRCVSATTRSKQELRRDLCAAEFNALKKCFTAAAKKVGM